MENISMPIEVIHPAPTKEESFTKVALGSRMLRALQLRLQGLREGFLEGIPTIEMYISAGWHKKFFATGYELASPVNKDFTTDNMLDDLQTVGPEKPLGHLPISTIIQIAERSPRDVARELIEAGKLVMYFPISNKSDGGLYVADVPALTALLQNNTAILSAYGAPSDPIHFIQYIDKHYATVDSSLYDLIAQAFGERRLSGRDMRQDNIAQVFKSQGFLKLLALERSIFHAQAAAFSPEIIANVDTEPALPEDFERERFVRVLHGDQPAIELPYYLAQTILGHLERANHLYAGAFDFVPEGDMQLQPGQEIPPNTMCLFVHTASMLEQVRAERKIGLPISYRGIWNKVQLDPDLQQKLKA